MTGVFHIVGVGPGDPELLTVRAARLITGATVVAWFGAAERTSRAFTTVESYVSPQAQTLRFTYPFTTGVPVSDGRYHTEMHAFYDACGISVARALDQGHAVTLLCEGDPFLYGSAMYLYDRLAAHYSCDVTPGISGMSGCWSAAGVPMAHGDDVLTVLPCTLDAARLSHELKTGGAFVFMKIGRNLPKLREVLRACDLEHAATYVEYATQPEQKIMPFTHAPTHAPYFSMVIIPGRKGQR